MRFAVILVMVALSAPAGAEAKTLLYASSGFKSKPARVTYRMPFLVGETLTVTGLRWRGWGDGRATARGRFKRCPNMAPCDRFRGRLTVSRLARGAEGTEDNIHARAAYTRRGRSAPLLRLCVYAEACELGPVGT